MIQLFIQRGISKIFSRSRERDSDYRNILTTRKTRLFLEFHGIQTCSRRKGKKKRELEIPRSPININCGQPRSWKLPYLPHNCALISFTFIRRTFRSISSNQTIRVHIDRYLLICRPTDGVKTASMDHTWSHAGHFPFRWSRIRINSFIRCPIPGKYAGDPR